MWKYTGQGDWWHPGIPMRDLTDSEVKELGITDVLKASAHYDYVSDEEHPRLAARAERASMADAGTEPARGGDA